VSRSPIATTTAPAACAMPWKQLRGRRADDHRRGDDRPFDHQRQYRCATVPQSITATISTRARTISADPASRGSSVRSPTLARSKATSSSRTASIEDCLDHHCTRKVGECIVGRLLRRGGYKNLSPDCRGVAASA
jgi:hypothetical protein